MSGDLNGDDLPNWANRGDNSETVVSATAPGPGVVLAGFTIRGASRSSATFLPGGGLLLVGVNATVEDCVVTDNYCYSSAGAGMRVSGGTLTMNRCVVSSNLADVSQGGGMYLAGTAVITDSRFEANTCKTSGNSFAHGGGIHADSGSQLTVLRCTFAGNWATHRFTSGNVSPDGGAIYCFTNARLTADECLFVDNHAGFGGAVSARFATIKNCVFNGNRAHKVVVGGGAGALTLTSGLVQGCTIYGNRADEEAGGVWFLDALVENSILWGNRDQRGSIGQSQVKGGKNSFNCIENMLIGIPGEDPPELENFPGCIDLDPQFVDADGPDNIAGNEDDDLRLLVTSPCLDRADPVFQSAGVDLTGTPRWLDGQLDGVLRVDMGAHEFTHVNLGLQFGAGNTATLTMAGSAGMTSVLIIGFPGSGGVVRPPLGALFLDLTLPFVAVPTGPVPAALAITYPTGSYDLMFQAAAVSGPFGNVSNPQLFAVR